MPLTQGGARPSLALGYFHIVPPGLRFGSLRSHFRRTQKLTGVTHWRRADDARYEVYPATVDKLP
jgi:hypothetical protein